MCFPAFAGEYKVTYSGGACTAGGAYTLGSNGWGKSGATAGNVSCSGKITATFTWDNKGNPADLPPKSVIVTEASTTSAGGFYRSVSGSVDTGLGESGTATPVPYQGTYTGLFTADVTKSKTRYTVKTVTSPLTVDCTPTASGSGSDFARASVAYSASATPVSINLQGTTADGTALKVLTGQQVKATLSGATIVPGSYQWQVLGAKPFRNFLVNEGGGQKYDLDATDKNQPELSFFTSANGEATVTCTAMAQLPDGNQSVTAEAKISSLKPTASGSSAALEAVTLNAPTSPDYTQATFFGRGAAPNANNGITWPVSLNIPSGFSGGQGSFIQIVTPSRSAFSKPTALNQPSSEYELVYAQGNVRINGVKGLDKSPDLYPFGVGITGEFVDTAVQGIDGAYSRITANDLFETWLMYQPPAVGTFATSKVPITKLSWNWNGSVLQKSEIASTGNTLSWLGLWRLGSGSSAGTASASNTDDFPDWVMIHAFATPSGQSLVGFIPKQP